MTDVKTKKELRKKKARLEIENKEKIKDYSDKYLKDISEEDLFNFSEAILQKKQQSNNNVIQLKALKQKVSSMKKSPKVKTYPQLDDPDFDKKIAIKKEFFIDKIPEIESELTIDEVAKKLCGKFSLSPNQKFLKKYLSENTNYNGILLYHGTGVGKTCSSISIAEQFVERLQKLNKKVFILLNPSIKANFIKNIFNIEKIKRGEQYEQCTRNKYLEMLDIDINSLKTQEDYDRVNKRVKKLIKNIYSFYGYSEFANMIEKIENITTPGITDAYKARIIQKRYQKMFSDTVLIIDEAHNIKEGGKDKVLPPIIKRVLTNSLNMKLVLLTATPMYDNAT